MNFAPLLAQGQQAGIAEMLSALALPALIFLVFYVIWFLPLRKRQREQEQVLAALEKGDRVVTNGGIYGKVVRADTDVLVLEIADNVKIRVRRGAIAGLEESPGQKG